MDTLIDVFTWLFNIAIGGLTIIALIFIFYGILKLLLWIFKYLCTIHAEIIAKEVRDELEDLLESRERKEE